MSNRRKVVAATAAISGAALVAARRRGRTHHVAKAEHAHHDGPRHVPVPGDELEATDLADRPWTKDLHGMRHPFSGD
jgi:hypothetical protein